MKKSKRDFKRYISYRKSMDILDRAISSHNHRLREAGITFRQSLIEFKQP